MVESLKTLLIRPAASTNTQFFRFLMAGALVVMADMAIFYSLAILLDLNHIVANSGAFVVGTVMAYFLSREWVFNQVEHQPGRDFMLFLIASVLCLAVSNSILYVLIDYHVFSMMIGNVSHDVTLVSAKISAVVAVAVFDFWLKRVFVFK